ncbi:MAG: DUF1698 domain-containing protein [Rhodobiaceae bacterium]|nr:DUF1698 domain-containing protein [Rhodobiaceae bacterium]MCC0040610.1 DUF1698 domain-containing protein [Rhodobiaceae bacterium]
MTQPAQMPLKPEDLAAFYWHHSIDLGNGVVTPGSKSLDTIAREADCFFAHGVKGMSVLDIGAWDGAFSFEAERRGASRVLATDHFCWVGDGPGKKAAFDIARHALNSKVEEAVVTVEDLDPARHGTFDVVLFLGVLYHLKNPMYGLECAAAMSHDQIVVETVIARGLPDHPPMAVFFPNSELNDDDTNWWAPTPACVEAMLRRVGFPTVEMREYPTPDTGANSQPAPAVSAFRRTRKRIKQQLRGIFQPQRQREVSYGRAIFHAWR